MKKKEIIPAILEKKFSGIEKKYKILEKNFFKKDKNFFIQIDICDGKLTPQKTFCSNFSKNSIKKIEKISKNFFLELDLIFDFKKIKNTKKIFEKIEKTKAKRIVFHNKGVKNWKEIFDFFEKKNIEIGCGIWLSEKNSSIEKILKEYKFDYIQIMGIEKVGFGGQKISPKVLEKIIFFKKKFPKIPIQIDGGVKSENHQKLFENGAKKFVSGSGIFSDKNIFEKIKNF